MSRILRSLDTPQVFRHQSEEHALTILYVFTQYCRTKYSVDAIDEGVDKLYKHILQRYPETQKFDLDQFKFGLNNVGLLSLKLAIDALPVLLDLDYKLLVNKTNIEIITSDNPVVLYNQLFTSSNPNCNNTGAASKGLQIFFPISPSCVLLFFDNKVYSVGKKGHEIVEITRVRDVYEINTLQVCSARDTVYFRDVNSDLYTLHNKASRFRRNSKINYQVYSNLNSKNETDELIGISRAEVKTNLKLSFVRITKSAKKWKREFVRQKYRPVSVVRNEQWLKTLETIGTRESEI